MEYIVILLLKPSQFKNRYFLIIWFYLYAILNAAALLLLQHSDCFIMWC